MMLAAWEVEPEASAVQKLSVRFPKGRLSMNGVIFTLGGGGERNAGRQNPWKDVRAALT